MTGWILFGVALAAIAAIAASRKTEHEDAVSEAWVKEQIRERGVRRQA